MTHRLVDLSEIDYSKDGDITVSRIRENREEADEEDNTEER